MSKLATMYWSGVRVACLQVSAEALQQSGGAVKSTGTYIGCMFVDYMSLQREAYGMSSTGAVSPNPAVYLSRLQGCNNIIIGLGILFINCGAGGGPKSPLNMPCTDSWGQHKELGQHQLQHAQERGRHAVCSNI